MKDLGLALFSAAVGSGENSLPAPVGWSCCQASGNWWKLNYAVYSRCRYQHRRADDLARAWMEKRPRRSCARPAKWHGPGMKHTVDPQSAVKLLVISICYEKGAAGGDAGLDWAGVDNIRAADGGSTVAEFCDLVVAGGSQR